MLAKNRKPATMDFDFGHNFAGQIQEVMLEKADVMGKRQPNRQWQTVLITVIICGYDSYGFRQQQRGGTCPFFALAQALGVTWPIS